MSAFRALFAELPDPRAANARHDLVDVLFIAFAAVLCGADTCQDMADFAVVKLEALRQVLRLRHGAPSHDTFSRIFRILDSAAFEAAFRGFMAAFADHLAAPDSTPIVALDGKSLSGAVESGARSTPLHLVTAWAVDQRLVLAQRKAEGRSEVTAALELVAMLDLEDTVVTADALHGSRRMAAAIRARGGDYVLALKGNRGPLFREARALLAAQPPAAGAASEKPAHGRHESRTAAVLAVPPDWPGRFKFQGLAAIARIDSTRRIGGRLQQQSRLFMLSVVLPPAEALRIVRAYWSIENQQHWLLDVVFREDRARSRKDNAGQNLGLLRRLALNLLHTDAWNASIRRKVKRAGWDQTYLLSLLSQMR
jgi:predicted transposase YbfD/YdcC